MSITGSGVDANTMKSPSPNSSMREPMSSRRRGLNLK